MVMDQQDKRQEVRLSIKEAAGASREYFIMNALATIIASFGLLADSAAVVIGAMVIAMLLGPITGISLGVVDADSRLLRKSLFAENCGVVLVIIVSFTIGRIFHEIVPGKEILSRTAPNILDLMIALAGGAAGAYATVSPRIGLGIIGVAIATALVPPLSVFGILLARGETEMALGGLLLFTANLVAIQFASSVVLWLQGYNLAIHRPEDRRSLLLRNGLSFGLLIVLAIVLGFNLKQSLDKERTQSAIRSNLQRAFLDYPGAHLAEIRLHRKGNKLIVEAVVRTPGIITPNQVEALSALLPPIDGRMPELHVRSVITAETSRTGYVHEPVFPSGSR
jgi:uncharacterized hydrophobic protein (TIGR00271 family)